MTGSDLRWSRFKHFAPKEMFELINDHIFPFLRTLGGDGSTYAHHMKDARFTIPTSALLAKVVDMIDQVPMEDRDTKGDLYEYMLGKIASASSHAVPPSGGSSSAKKPAKAGTTNEELARPRTAQSFCVPKADIAAQGYDFSLNRYKEVVHEEVTHRKPREILKALGKLETEIQQGMKELEGMLK